MNVKILRIMQFEFATWIDIEPEVLYQMVTLPSWLIKAIQFFR
jgi:hypothetical protein